MTDHPLPRHLRTLTGWLAAILAAALPLLGAGLALPAVAAPYSFSSVDLPGAVDTKFRGINNAGTIVGWTDNGGCCGTGFIRAANGVVQSVTIPGSVNISEIYGIAQHGQVSGSYYDGAKLWGYTLWGQNFARIDPGAPNDIFAFGLNDIGQVVGSYSLDGGATSLGFVKTPSGYASIDLGSDHQTAVRGIDAGGRIVGNFSDAGLWHGFELTGATLRQIDVPAPGTGFTFANGTNNAGDVVGWWQDANSAGSAYIEHGGVVTSFNMPGAAFTIANAVNDHGVIVGEWGDAQNLIHGFVATPVPEPESAPLLAGGLGLLALLLRRRARTVASLAAAFACAAPAPALAFNPQPDPPARFNWQWIDLPGVYLTQAYGINNTGDVVGNFFVSTSDAVGQGYVRHANGQIDLLTVPDASFNRGYAINNAGDVAGSFIRSGIERGFLQNAQGQTLLQPPGSTFAYAQGLNDHDRVVGSGTLAQQRFGWDWNLRSGFRTLSVPGQQSFFTRDVDNAGRIVGSFIASAHPSVTSAVLIEDPNLFVFSVPGASLTEFNAINENGWIVGRYIDGTGSHGLIVHGDRWTSLDMPGGANTTLLGVSDRNQIVGQYDDATLMHTRSFSAALVPEPATWALLCAGLALTAGLARRSAACAARPVL